MNRAECPEEGVKKLKNVPRTFVVQGFEKMDALVPAFSRVLFLGSWLIEVFNRVSYFMKNEF